MSEETKPEVVAAEDAAIRASMSPEWTEVVGRFAADIQQDLLAVTKVMLKNFVPGPTDESIKKILAVDTAVRDADWTDAFPGIKGPMLRSAVGTLRKTTPVVVAAAPVATPSAPRMALLPALPVETSALDALVVGGTFNGTLTPRDALRAVKVAMSVRSGIYDLPEKIIAKIRAYGENMTTMPSDMTTVSKLIRDIKKRKYADILDDFGAEGAAVTQETRKLVMARINTHLWPALRRHFDIVHAWSEAQRAQGLDMNAFVVSLAAFAQGNPALAQNFNAPQEAEMLRSSTADLIQAVNRLFAGYEAYPAVIAMAADAIRLTEYLDPTKPHLGVILQNTGMATRDDLLRSIDMGITEAFQRAERAIMQYMFAAFSMKDVPEEQVMAYATQLHSIGMSIPWNDLTTASASFPTTGAHGSNYIPPTVNPREPHAPFETPRNGRAIR